MATQIKLDKALHIVKRAEDSADVTSVTFLRTVDIPSKKVVAAWVAEIRQGPVVLWQGAAYDLAPASSWTNDDIIARLKEVLSAGEPPIWNGGRESKGKGK